MLLADKTGDLLPQQQLLSAVISGKKREKMTSYHIANQSYEFLQREAVVVCLEWQGGFGGSRSGGTGKRAIKLKCSETLKLPHNRTLSLYKNIVFQK